MISMGITFEASADNEQLFRDVTPLSARVPPGGGARFTGAHKTISGGGRGSR